MLLVLLRGDDGCVYEARNFFLYRINYQKIKVKIFLSSFYCKNFYAWEMEAEMFEFKELFMR